MVKIKRKRKSKTTKLTYNMHPNRIAPLVAQSCQASGPGPYEMNRAEGVYNPVMPGVWDRQRETQQFSQFFGYRYVQDERAYRQSLGGTYGIPHGAWDQGATIDGKESGSKTKIKKTKKIKSSKKRKKFRKVPKYEWDGINGAKPIRYGVKAPCLTNKTKNDCKNPLIKRGVYDCFAGNNLIEKPNFHSPSNKQCYDISNHLDVLLHHPVKSHYGKFLKAERFPQGMRVKVTRGGVSSYVKDPDFPGPGHYNLGGGGDAAMPPPKSQKRKTKPIKHVGRPARDSKPIKGMQVAPQTSWMFASKTKR